MPPDLPDKLAKKRWPRRAIEGSAIAPSPKALTKIARRLQKRDAKQTLKIYEHGTTTALEPELTETRVAAHALLRAPTTEAIAKASLDALAAAEVMLMRIDRELSLVEPIVLARGLLDAVEAKTRSLRLALGAEPGGWMRAVYVVTRTEPDRSAHTWLRLRHAVCAADERAYADARARAAELRAGLEPFERAHLALVFPDEPWADEDVLACLALPAQRGVDFGFLLSACHDPKVVRAYLGQPGSAHAVARHALDLVGALREGDAIAILADALPALLKKPKYGALHKTPPREVATALSCFRTEAAAARLAPYASDRALGAVVAAYFQSAPELAPVLAAHGSGDAARRIVAQVHTARAASEDAGPVAEDALVPSVLLDRPWRPRKPKPKLLVVEGVTIAPGFEERVELTEAERAGDFEVRAGSPLVDMTSDELAGWRERVRSGEFVAADYTSRYAGTGRTRTLEHVRVPREEGLRAFNEGRTWLAGGPIAFLASHGAAAIGGFVTQGWLRWLAYDPGYLDAACRIVSPRIAPRMAEIAARRKKHRRRALGWLAAHPDAAAIGLVPNAVGGRSSARDDAEAALLYLAHRGETAAVRAAARAHGEAVARAIEAMLARDPLAIDRKAPKAPDFLRPDDLPPLALQHGGRLPDDARDALLEMLSVSPLDPPYPGLAPVQDALEPASLAHFVRALVDQWVLADAPGRQEWMLYAAVFFASDEVTRGVASLARDWARRDQAKAKRACGALAAIGSDLALLHLGHIAETSRFAALREEASERLGEVADARGLSPDELADRTVPDLGLGPDGRMTLEYGARRFFAQIDASCAVVLMDADGRRLRSLPRAGDDDDAPSVEACKESLKALRKDAASIAQRQVRRLERAMVEGRWWSRDELTARIATHPLLVHVARGLVWEAVEGDATRTFRIAEDGTFADAADDQTALDEDARVRIGHPLRLGVELEPWSGIFSDYELVQPFDQLGRSTFAPAAREGSRTTIERAVGVELPATKILGLLEARGWARDDRGLVRGYVRTVAGLDGPVEARLALTPGFEIAELRYAPAQRVGALSLHRGASAARLDSLDPVSYSELARDLETLRA